jgi:hypothetical protein
VAEVHISALHLDPALGSLIDLRVWLDPVQPLPAAGLQVRLRQDGRGALDLPTQVHLSETQPVQALRVRTRQAGEVTIAAEAEPYDSPLRIPVLRPTGQVESPAPIVLRARTSVEVRPLLPAAPPGTCTREAPAPALVRDTFGWSNWHGNQNQTVTRVKLGLTGTTMAERAAEVAEAVLFRGGGWR